MMRYEEEEKETCLVKSILCGLSFSYGCSPPFASYVSLIASNPHAHQAKKPPLQLDIASIVTCTLSHPLVYHLSFLYFFISHHYQVRGQWRAFEEMQAEGTVGTLSVSNFSPQQLDVVLKVQVDGWVMVADVGG
jgi:hypothetical protein